MRRAGVMQRRACVVCGRLDVAHTSDGVPHGVHCRGERHRLCASWRASVELDGVTAIFIGRTAPDVDE